MRLTGVNSLKFKAHLLSDAELLDLIEELLNSFREEMAIKTIKILQRLDGVAISKLLTKTVENGSEETANAALMALGSIETSNSYKSLTDLSETLSYGCRRDIDIKQLSQQYNISSNAIADRQIA